MALLGTRGEGPRRPGWQCVDTLGLDRWTPSTQIALLQPMPPPPFKALPSHLIPDPTDQFRPLGIMQSRCYTESKGTLEYVNCHEPHSRASSGVSASGPSASRATMPVRGAPVPFRPGAVAPSATCPESIPSNVSFLPITGFGSAMLPTRRPATPISPRPAGPGTSLVSRPIEAKERDVNNFPVSFSISAWHWSYSTSVLRRGHPKTLVGYDQWHPELGLLFKSGGYSDTSPRTPPRLDGSHSLATG